MEDDVGQRGIFVDLENGDTSRQWGAPESLSHAVGTIIYRNDMGGEVSMKQTDNPVSEHRCTLALEFSSSMASSPSKTNIFSFLKKMFFSKKKNPCAFSLPIISSFWLLLTALHVHVPSLNSNSNSNQVYPYFHFDSSTFILSNLHEIKRKKKRAAEEPNQKHVGERHHGGFD